MLKKKYVLYGLSILFSRGIEYLVILFLAKYLNTSEFGEFEYYKRWIELGAVFLSFGFPVLIQTYTKTNIEKDDFLIIGFAIVLSLSLALVIPLSWMGLIWLVPALFFYAFFYHGGSILQSYHIVRKTPSFITKYKISIAVAISILTVFFALYSSNKSFSLVYALSFMLVPCLIYFVILLKGKLHFKHLLAKLKEYEKVFEKMIFVVLESVFNIAFLFSDVILVEYYSNSLTSFEVVANYSFPLTISSSLMMISMSIVQMDIEELKTNQGYIKTLSKKLDVFLLLGAVALVVLYYVMINTVWVKFEGTFMLFLLLIVMKFFLCSSISHGTLCLIRGYYKKIFYIALISFIGNIALSYGLYQLIGVYGVATSTLFFVFIRYYYLRIWGR